MYVRRGARMLLVSAAKLPLGTCPILAVQAGSSNTGRARQGAMRACPWPPLRLPLIRPRMHADAGHDILHRARGFIGGTAARGRVWAIFDARGDDSTGDGARGCIEYGRARTNVRSSPTNARLPARNGAVGRYTRGT